MAYFAKMDNGLVENVIYIENINVNNLDFPDSEPIGQTFIASCNIDGDYLQTSYNGNFRGCYAGLNYSFNQTLGEYGEFIPPIND